MKLKGLLRSFNLLNLLLLAVLILVLQYLLLPMASVDVRYKAPAAKKGSDTEAQAGEPSQSVQVPSLMEYTVIAEQNLFHPERRIPPEKKEAPPLPKPEFVLYGILLSEEMTIAYIEDLKAPQSTPGRGKRQTALKKGDSLSGFVLKEVEAEKVVMVRGEERMDVYLTDAQRPKKREFAGTTPQTPAQPGATPGAVQPAAAPARGAVTQTPPAATSAPPPAASAPAAAPAAKPADKESARRAFTDLLMRGKK